MTRRFASTLAVAGFAVLGGCRGDRAGGDGNPPADTTVAAVQAPAWRTNPATGPVLGGGPGSMTVETGPHTILWPAGEQELAPPYTIRATFEKKRGRLHEGYGILFGGTGLDGADAATDRSSSSAGRAPRRPWCATGRSTPPSAATWTKRGSRTGSKWP
jgi:hypothetical protein